MPPAGPRTPCPYPCPSASLPPCPPTTTALPPLQVLTKKFLKRTIQEGSHDSVVDALAALHLAQLKIKHGGVVGVVGVGGLWGLLIHLAW